jgi:hypothetical protein
MLHRLVVVMVIELVVRKNSKQHLMVARLVLVLAASFSVEVTQEPAGTGTSRVPSKNTPSRQFALSKIIIQTCSHACGFWVKSGLSSSLRQSLIHPGPRAGRETAGLVNRLPSRSRRWPLRRFGSRGGRLTAASLWGHFSASQRSDPLDRGGSDHRVGITPDDV